MNNHQPLSLLLIQNVGNITAIKTLNSIKWQPRKYSDTEFIEQLQNIKFNKVDEARSSLEKAKLIIDQNFSNQVIAVSYFEKDYPLKFKEINNPPLILYYKGNFKHFLQSTNIAIVGTRKPSDNGRRLSFEVAQAVTENSSSAALK